MRRAVIGTVVGLAGAAFLIYVGPRPISLATGHTGDERIAAFLAEHAERGHNELAGFVYDQGEVTFGGLGADEHTEFEIGSITKTFNGELARQQVADGSLTLDTTVGSLVDVPDAPIADVTIEELMNHTSGLKRLEGMRLVDQLFARGNPYRGYSAQDILDAAANAELDGRGEEHYSNYGHALLGQLLALNAGVDYETLLRTRIFEPAGMTETYLATPETAGDASPGYALNGRETEPWDMDGWAPAGAIRSTAADMAKYVEWIIDHGDLAYGWGEWERDGATYVFHNGGTGGFRTMLVWDPVRPDRAAYVASNTAASVDDLGVALLSVDASGGPR